MGRGFLQTSTPGGGPCCNLAQVSPQIWVARNWCIRRDAACACQRCAVVHLLAKSLREDTRDARWTHAGIRREGKVKKKRETMYYGGLASEFIYAFSIFVESLSI